MIDAELPTERIAPLPDTSQEYPLPAHDAAASAAVVTDAQGAASPEASSNALRDLILASLDDDQASDVLCIDLAGKSSIADTLVIASGRSQRHVGAMADHLLRKIKEAGHGNARVEGLANADWVLIDTGDVIAHLFRPEVRQFYAIERIWADGGTRHAAGAA
jgi:ribosome-associated protein